MPVTSAISVSTISSSMSVTPRCEPVSRVFRRLGARRLLIAPADNVCVVPFSARLPVGAQRNDVGLVTVFAGEFVEIRMAPNIGGCVLRQIRSGPLIDTVRLHAQRIQPHLS